MAIDARRDKASWDAAPPMMGHRLRSIEVCLADAKREASMGYRFGFKPKIKKFKDPTGVLRGGLYGVYLNEK
jgi:hypothetical protein